MSKERTLIGLPFIQFRHVPFLLSPKSSRNVPVFERSIDQNKKMEQKNVSNQTETVDRRNQNQKDGLQPEPYRTEIQKPSKPRNLKGIKRMTKKRKEKNRINFFKTRPRMFMMGEIGPS